MDARGSRDELEKSMDPPTYAADVLPTATVKPSPVAAIEKSTGIKPPSAQPTEQPGGTKTVVISAKSIQDIIDAPPKEDASERTIIAPPDFTLPSMPSLDEPEEDDGDGATMMVASAAIVIIEPASMSQEFQLSAVNGIGRSEENQICLLNPGISRKHAIIKAVPGGYAI